MVEKDGFMTVELSKNGKLLESYSSQDTKLIRECVERFSKKIVPKFQKLDECENDRYEIHMYTY